MHAEARKLLRERTSRADDWLPRDLLEIKSANQITVSVVLPALNEERTVGSIVDEIRDAFVVDDLREPSVGTGLVDELIVLDSGSTDRTAKVARAAGATVIHRDEVIARIPAVTGKGEAMWRAVAASTGDLIVFVDADLRSFTPSYITGLLGPLLTQPSVDLVKAVYERPLIQGEQVSIAGGGRVTELVARPLLNLYWPQLAGVVQPLAGEYAARRSLLEQLAFPCDYGIDFAMLVDTAELAGVEAIAQVDLGTRLHRHHDERRLGRMSAEILQTAWSRLGVSAKHVPDGALGATLAQFDHDGSGYAVTTHEVGALERPPLLTVPEYGATRVAAPLPRGTQSA